MLNVELRSHISVFPGYQWWWLRITAADRRNILYDRRIATRGASRQEYHILPPSSTARPSLSRAGHLSGKEKGAIASGNVL
jgi:hypothetical protein